MMAMMIPDRLAEDKPYGEKRVFELLKRLPNSCFVYYEPKIGNYYPDFVVLMPTIGVLFIEVKGWYLESIIRANPKTVSTVSIRKHKDSQVQIFDEIHPLEQSRKYKNSFRDLVKLHPELLKQDKGYRGYPVFPLWQIAVLSNIDRFELNSIPAFMEDIIPDDVFPEAEVITRDELAHLCDGEYSEVDLLRVLKEYFPAENPNLRWDIHLTDKQVSILHSILAPEFGEVRKLQSLSILQNLWKAVSKILFGYRCPLCGAKMVMRHSHRDGRVFWGCEKYPDCHVTLNDNNGKPMF